MLSAVLRDISKLALQDMRDDFSVKVVQKLAERAGYICSNPACNRITVGPVAADPTRSTKTGIAAHICAAAPGGPRYDMSQTTAERAGISNAIWLCATCSTLIDKNKGMDYPANYLRRWKRDHEELIKTCLEGGKRAVFQFLKAPTDHSSANQLLTFMQQRGVLFVPMHGEYPPHVFDSIKEIRIFLTQLQANLDTESPLAVIVDSINHACRHFMNTTSIKADYEEVLFGLGALRKIIGLNIGDLAKLYGLTVSGPLRDAIPRA
jgi:hypothetical protein